MCQSLLELDAGRCLFRDHSGRVEAIQVEVVVPSLLRAFSTTPAELSEESAPTRVGDARAARRGRVAGRRARRRRLLARRAPAAGAQGAEQPAAGLG